MYLCDGGSTRPVVKAVHVLYWLVCGVEEVEVRREARQLAGEVRREARLMATRSDRALVQGCRSQCFVQTGNAKLVVIQILAPYSYFDADWWCLARHIIHI